MCRKPRRARIVVLLTVVAGLMLSPIIAGVAYGAPVVQQRYQIVVSAVPDLAGDGPYAPDCSGCDGQFEAGDSIRGRLDPLPPLVFALKDASGDELRRYSSAQQSSGRQQVTFFVDEPGTYYVELVREPGEWQLCPGSAVERAVEADDFEATSGMARLQFGFWHGCDAVSVVTSTSLPPQTQAATEEPPATEPSEGPGEATAVPTLEPVPTGEGELPVGAEQEAQAHPSAVLEPPIAGSGVIRGLVYVDTNEDGQLGPDEPGVPGILVYLVNGGWLQQMHTTGAGNFEFSSLAPDTYEVSIDVPAGYRFTTTDRHTYELVEGEEVAGIDFGLVPPESQVPAAVPLPGLGLPSTGVLPQSSGRVLLGLAAAIGALGLLGFAIESRSARRS